MLMQQRKVPCPPAAAKASYDQIQEWKHIVKIAMLSAYDHGGTVRLFRISVDVDVREGSDCVIYIYRLLEREGDAECGKECSQRLDKLGILR